MSPNLPCPDWNLTSPPPHTPQREATPGGKKGQLDSKVHPSFFTSLDIPVLPDQEFFRVRVWPVLVREKNSQKETLVHSKNQASPSLTLNIRIMGLAETE
jgi:hypothetical protein